MPARAAANPGAARLLRRTGKVSAPTNAGVARDARSSGWQGHDRLHLNASGYVIEANVVSASNADLGELGRIAVLYWKLEPVVKNGVAIEGKAVQPMIFGASSQEAYKAAILAVTKEWTFKPALKAGVPTPAFRLLAPKPRSSCRRTSIATTRAENPNPCALTPLSSW